MFGRLSDWRSPRITYFGSKVISGGAVCRARQDIVIIAFWYPLRADQAAKLAVFCTRCWCSVYKIWEPSRAMVNIWISLGSRCLAIGFQPRIDAEERLVHVAVAWHLPFGKYPHSWKSDLPHKLEEAQPPVGNPVGFDGKVTFVSYFPLSFRVLPSCASSMQLMRHSPARPEGHLNAVPITQQHDRSGQRLAFSFGGHGYWSVPVRSWRIFNWRVARLPPGIRTIRYRPWPTRKGVRDENCQQ